MNELEYEKKATPLLAYSILHSSVAFVCNLGRYYILGISYLEPKKSMMLQIPKSLHLKG